MAPTLTIGEFSRMTHISIRALRRYHEAGLLVPANVDPATGYRHYGVEQVSIGQVIHHFRQVGMPLKELTALVTIEDPDERAAVIAHHLARLEAQLDETRSAIASVRRLLRPGVAPVAVDIRRTEATPVAAVRDVVDRRDVLTWYGAAMAEIDRVLATAGVVPTGPPGGLYDDALFADERGAAMVYVPVAEPPASGRVAPHVLPAAELAATVHTGPHDDVDVTYGALGTYISQHALRIDGPVREIYHVGPRDTGDSAAWRTEIAWPIFRTWKDVPSPGPGGPTHHRTTTVVGAPPAHEA